MQRGLWLCPQDLDNEVRIGFGNPRVITGDNTIPAEYVDPNYHYGYPAYGDEETGVVAQFLFDEFSGNIVDQVSGLTVTASGSPGYRTASTGLFSGINPGITFNGLNPGGSFFQKNSATTELDIGTSDFVIEWWSTEESPNTVNGDRFIFSTWKTGNGVELYWSGNDLVFFMQGNAGANSVQMNTTLTSLLNDGLIHKYRLSGSRAGSVVLYVDGVEKNSMVMTDLIGVNVTAGLLVFGQTEPPGAGAEYKGTLYEFRVTVGNATNNSGGPGGG